MAVNRHVFYFLFYILFLLLLLFLFIFISLVPPQCRNAPPLPFSMHVSGIFALSKATSTSPLPYSTYKLPNGDCVVLPSPMPLFSTDLRQWAIRIDEVETQVARGARLHFNLVSCPPPALFALPLLSTKKVHHLHRLLTNANILRATRPSLTTPPLPSFRPDHGVEPQLSPAAAAAAAGAGAGARTC